MEANLFPSFIKLQSDLIIRAIIIHRLNFKKFKIEIEPKVLYYIIKTRHLGGRPGNLYWLVI